MAEPGYQLSMNTGPTPGKSFPLEKSELYIGRDLTNDIVINDAEISRRHARLIAQTGGYVLEDLGSTNGTFINGQRLSSPYILRSGETVTFGEHVSLTYEQVIPDLDATMVSGAVTSAAPMPPASEAVIVTPSRPDRPDAPLPPSSFSGQVPQSPVMVVEPPEPMKRRGPATWVIVLIVVLLLLLCACAGIVYLVDANSLWCRFLPFIPGCS